MGIGRSAVALLYELKDEHPFHGSILELGKQSLYVNGYELPKIANRFGHTIDISDITMDANGEYLNNSYDDVVLFKKLGFNDISSLDISPYEGADYIHDLNTPIPESLKGKFDFIYDGGTMEHLFNIPQCLWNIHDLLKPGGLVMHCSPSHNNVDHGFYMFSPTLFWDYYTQNNYDIVRSQIFEHRSEHSLQYKMDWTIYDYQPGCIESLAGKGWGRKKLGIWFVAKKHEESTRDIVPQQGKYLAIWENQIAFNPYQDRYDTISFKNVLRRILYLVPGMKRLITAINGWAKALHAEHWRQPRPPVVGRY